ncbi:hypothetical protein DNL40_12260 [Xylanimonas oleitrophica]|uniref:Uncharacterized protein n=1 Tax=Xylanimonas oleitrophica TaxID=2607479 RepID=A0A2W5WNU6_9MICO|nr:hypothetical protein [Xylanimonas oleitrophica]PZR52433.1 hypothetical protein DNL40_12260 [Xylanimonas oleitrophica]
MTTVTEAPTPGVEDVKTCDETGALIITLAADVEGYVRRRLRTAGTTAVMRDELGDLASATGELVGDVTEILWTKRAQWAPLCAEDQRRWTFAVARNLIAQRIKAARTTHVRRSEVAPMLDGLAEPGVVDPRLDALAGLRLLVESKLGDAAWATISAAIERNHSPALRADVAAALEARAAGRTPVIRAIVRRCRVDWRPWALARIDAGHPLQPSVAVSLGLFATLVKATSTLTTWWVEQRTAFDQPLDAEALVCAGLVEHLGRTQSARREAAAGLLVWVSASRGAEVARAA